MTKLSPAKSRGNNRATNWRAQTLANAQKGRFESKTGRHVSPNLASNDLTNDELLARAKQKIETGESKRNISFRDAAEDIAHVCSRGVIQRDAAKRVNKSAAWVNRLLKWREGGYVGAPFADKAVQGVNKEPTQPAPSASTPAAPATSNDICADAVAIHEAIKPETTLSTAASTATPACTNHDFHLPQSLNRQDPDQAFQRLSEQWASISFHGMFLNSPQSAQLRFLREVVLPEIGGLDALKLLLVDSGIAQ